MKEWVLVVLEILVYLTLMVLQVKPIQSKGHFLEFANRTHIREIATFNLFVSVALDCAPIYTATILAALLVRAAASTHLVFHYDSAHSLFVATHMKTLAATGATLSGSSCSIGSLLGIIAALLLFLDKHQVVVIELRDFDNELVLVLELLLILNRLQHGKVVLLRACGQGGGCCEALVEVLQLASGAEVGRNLNLDIALDRPIVESLFFLFRGRLLCK